MQSKHIDVSYFSAGIVAHLASDGRRAWAAAKREQRLKRKRVKDDDGGGDDRMEDGDKDNEGIVMAPEDCLMRDLEEVIERWQTPNEEMVAYR